MQGFNVALKVDNKTFAGRTQDDLNISAVTKESLTKDDKGNAQQKVTGHNVTFKVSGLMDNSTEEPTRLTRDEVIEMSLRTGDDAIIPVRYGEDGGKIYGGNAIITGYTESTNAQGEATYGLDLAVSGEFKLITGASTGE